MLHMALPRVEVDVVAHSEGRAVVRLAGRKMPLLLLDVKTVADLEQLFAAAALRIDALGDAAASDAIKQFTYTFRKISVRGSFFGVKRRFSTMKMAL